MSVYYCYMINATNNKQSDKCWTTNTDNLCVLNVHKMHLLYVLLTGMINNNINIHEERLVS